MARPKNNNVQINISIPSEWKIELENLARIIARPLPPRCAALRGPLPSPEGTAFSRVHPNRLHKSSRVSRFALVLQKARWDVDLPANCP